MTCGCISQIGGNTPGSGGGGVVLNDGWESVYEVDFRAVPPINLNGNLITFVDQGVTWSSPESIIPGVTTFAITAAGLVVDMTNVNSRFASTNQSAPHIWTRMQSFPGYSMAREMLVMIYISALTGPSPNDLALVGNYAPSSNSGDVGRLAFSNNRAISISKGFANGAANTVRLLEGTATTAFVPVTAPTDVLGMRIVSGTVCDFGAHELGAGAFPTPSALLSMGPYMGPGLSFEDEYWNNEFYNRIATGFTQENLSATQMTGTIQRLAVLLR